ncbi:MAG TPA: CU044_2847 family protein [Nonomuraea sp.]|nr:CU044_2847 family protein [Nonomuraea sp.]
MGELQRWESDWGTVVVEVGDEDAGYASISRSPGEVVHDVKTRFEDALANVRAAAETAVRAFLDDALDPDEVSLEFGVKLNAEAGAVIAQTPREGHFVVRIGWTRGKPA